MLASATDIVVIPIRVISLPEMLWHYHPVLAFAPRGS